MSNTTLQNFHEWWPQQKVVDRDIDSETKALYKAIFDAGLGEGVKAAVPEGGNNNNPRLRLARYTTTILSVYQERDKLRDEVSELTGVLDDAQKMNNRFHKLLDAAKEVSDYWKGYEADQG